MAQTPSASIPIRFQPDRARRMRWRHRDARQPERDPTIENQNFPCLRSELLRPRGRGVPFGPQASRTPRDETALLSGRSEEHTSELQSLAYLVCRLLLEK